MTITFDRAIQETNTVHSFYFTPEKAVSYTAGQFVELTLPHKNPDSRGTKRWFTISSSPTEDKIRITTKFAADKGSSFKNALLALSRDSQLTMSDPMGDFVLPKIVQTPLVFIAGGIGITPFLSMLQWLKDTGEVRPIKLLYAVSSEDEISFQDTFQNVGQHATIVVSNPSASWGGERGHLTAEMILGLEMPDDNTLVFVSGPETLVEALTKDLQKAGLKKSQVVGDYFPNYPAE